MIISITSAIPTPKNETSRAWRCKPYWFKLLVHTVAPSRNSEVSPKRQLRYCKRRVYEGCDALPITCNCHKHWRTPVSHKQIIFWYTEVLNNVCFSENGRTTCTSLAINGLSDFHKQRGYSLQRLMHWSFPEISKCWKSCCKKIPRISQRLDKVKSVQTCE